MANVEAVTRSLARWLPSALWLAGLLAASPAVAAEPRAQGVLILLPGQPTGTQTGIDAFAWGTRSALVEALPPGSSVYVEIHRPGASPDVRRPRPARRTRIPWRG